MSVDEGYCRWSTVKQWWEGTATGATDKHDGMKKQQMIMEISDWHSKYPAFAWCAEHGSDWYLPAVVYRMVDKTLSRINIRRLTQDPMFHGIGRLLNLTAVVRSTFIH